MQEGKILAVDDWDTIRNLYSGPNIDLGEQVILPGLINTHCHLDYTLMSGKFTKPPSFTSWIQSMVQEKRQWSEADFQNSWAVGFGKLLKTGTTCIGDTVSDPTRFEPQQIGDGPRLIPFYECIHLDGTTMNREQLELITDKIKNFRTKKFSRAGISPHALYTTSKELWRTIRSEECLRSAPISIHLAESAEEFDLFSNNSGRMYEWFNTLGHLPKWGKGSPISLLEQSGHLSKGMIAAHVNMLGTGDLERLAENDVQIVHCPRSHAYFDHPPFPIGDFQSRGINISLGTDSLASVSDEHFPESLSLFHDMRLLSEGKNAVRPVSILEMGTINGAKALGLDQVTGSLEPGKSADWISLPWGGDSKGFYEQIIGHSEHVQSAWIDGKRFDFN